jgi:hypothetical protein
VLGKVAVAIPGAPRPAWTSKSLFAADLADANDAAPLAAALGHIARARGIPEIIESAVITPQPSHRRLRIFSRATASQIVNRTERTDWSRSRCPGRPSRA